MAGKGKGILVLPAHTIADRHPFGMGAHVAILDRAPQTVGDGRVDEFAIAKPVTEAGGRQQVWGAVHRFHATCDDNLRVAGTDFRGAEHDRLEPGPADPVDRRSTRRVGETGAQGRLPRRCLTRTRLEHLAHQDLVDRRPIWEPGTFDGGANGDTTQLDGRDSGQRARELPDRCPRRADDVDVAIRGVGAVGAASILHARSLRRLSREAQRGATLVSPR